MIKIEKNNMITNFTVIFYLIVNVSVQFINNSIGSLYKARIIKNNYYCALYAFVFILFTGLMLYFFVQIL